MVHRGKIGMLKSPYRMDEGNWDKSNEYVLLGIVAYPSPVFTKYMTYSTVTTCGGLGMVH